MNMKSRFGFTLAEVLITLGIIGVVAAMTMPVLSENISNAITVNKLKKINSVLAQAMLFTVVEDGDYNSLNVVDNNINSMQNWYNEALRPQLQIAGECINTSGCWAKNTKTLGGVTPYMYREGVGIGTHIIVFNTPDGYNVSVDSYIAGMYERFGVKPKNSSHFIVVFVDVNGFQKPNVVGKDIFTFVFSPDRGFVPAGRDRDDSVINANCKLTNQTTEGGYFCAEKLVRNNWKMDKNFYK